MFPSPTAKPMHDSRYWALLSHLGLASAPLEASSFPILSWQWTPVLLLTSTGGTQLHLVKNTLVSRGLFQVTPTALLSSSALLYWPVRCGRFLLAYMARTGRGWKHHGHWVNVYSIPWILDHLLVIYTSDRKWNTMTQLCCGEAFLFPQRSH